MKYTEIRDTGTGHGTGIEKRERYTGYGNGIRERDTGYGSGIWERDMGTGYGKGYGNGIWDTGHGNGIWERYLYGIPERKKMHVRNVAYEIPPIKVIYFWLTLHIKECSNISSTFPATDVVQRYSQLTLHSQAAGMRLTLPSGESSPAPLSALDAACTPHVRCLGTSPH